MSRSTGMPLLVAALVATLVVAACGGGPAASPGISSAASASGGAAGTSPAGSRSAPGASPVGSGGAAGASPVASGSVPGASPAASATETIPAASFTGGRATASLSLAGGEPIRFAGGYCERPIGDAWLAVNIGDPNGAEYFGLLVGPHPFGGSGASPVAGGGSFSDRSILVTWRHAGTGAALARGSVTVEVEAGAWAGSFSGRLDDDTEVTGDFGC